MKSLKDNKTEQEYLWQADQSSGEEHHRFFSPIVGEIMRRSSRYTKEKTYTLSQHGFARDMEFDLESQTEEERFGLY